MCLTNAQRLKQVSELFLGLPLNFQTPPRGYHASDTVSLPVSFHFSNLYGTLFIKEGRVPDILLMR
jgi:hypothetical protein